MDIFCQLILCCYWIEKNHSRWNRSSRWNTHKFRKTNVPWQIDNDTFLLSLMSCMIVLIVEFQVRGYTINSLICLKVNKFKVIVQTRMMSNWQKLGTTFSQKQTFFVNFLRRSKNQIKVGSQKKKKKMEKKSDIYFIYEV